VEGFNCDSSRDVVMTWTIRTINVFNVTNNVTKQSMGSDTADERIFGKGIVLQKYIMFVCIFKSITVRRFEQEVTAGLKAFWPSIYFGSFCSFILT